jgi:hypothetical protein
MSLLSSSSRLFVAPGTTSSTSATMPVTATTPVDTHKAVRECFMNSTFHDHAPRRRRM